MAGVWCGIVSRLIGCLALLSLPYLFIDTLQRKTQTLMEFARSGSTDLATYIVGDFSAAATNHLVIGLLLGLILGVRLRSAWRPHNHHANLLSAPAVMRQLKSR